MDRKRQKQRDEKTTDTSKPRTDNPIVDDSASERAIEGDPKNRDNLHTGRQGIEDASRVERADTRAPASRKDGSRLLASEDDVALEQNPGHERPLPR